VAQYKDNAVLPDPSFILTMGNVIAQDSNFYAVQKTFDGAFSFDVIFDSQSAGTDISGELAFSPSFLQLS
jgi:mannosyl-oligosaccharide glucosidase